jgi:hypothetical protein
MPKGADSPPSPDPAIQTAQEAAANRYNINSPFGKQTWSSGGREVVGYDSTGKPIYGEKQTQNIELAPSEQRQYDTRNEISETLMGQGLQGIQSGLPEFSDLEANPGRPGDLDLGDRFDLNAASSPAADAHFQRVESYMRPYQEREADAWEQRMANQGLPVGSEAYGESLGELKDTQNRAMLDASYESAMRAPELAMQERGQQTSESLAQQADARTGFQQYQGERGRQFNEDLTRRQNYYNEIAAALGGQQLNPLNAGGGGGDMPLDVGGAYAQYNQAQMAGYNAAEAAKRAQTQGMWDFASAAVSPWSDERLKDDIEQVGELPSGEGVYDFHYKWEGDDEPLHTGVMAQEIEGRYPEAVIHDPSGFRKVDYRKLIAHVMAEAA